jgi:hypothetical protein
METIKVPESEPQDHAVGLVRYLGRDGIESNWGDWGGGLEVGPNDAEVSISSLRHLEVDIEPN